MAKVKLFALIPRKPGVSAQEFHDHWRHPHGTLARRISLIRKYVQSHQLHSSVDGIRESVFEGVAEVWMDSAADAMSLGQEPWYVEHLIPDERIFIDLPNLRFLVTEEDVIVSSPNPGSSLTQGDRDWFDDDRAVNIKVLQFIEPAHDATWRQARDAQLGRDIGAFRHVRCVASREAQPDASGVYAGVRELWWPTLSAFLAGVGAAPAALQELLGANGPAVLVQAERFK